MPFGLRPALMGSVSRQLHDVCLTKHFISYIAIVFDMVQGQLEVLRGRVVI